jgi:hypothetical protein
MVGLPRDGTRKKREHELFYEVEEKRHRAKAVELRKFPRKTGYRYLVNGEKSCFTHQAL